MDGELLTITPDKFEEFEHDLWAQQIDNPNGIAPLPTPAAGSCPPGPLQDFQKGIRRDMSSYPTIKNIEQWDNWRRVFEATAKAQGVNNILDPKYNPSNPPEAQLHSESFLCRILHNGFGTGSGSSSDGDWLSMEFWSFYWFSGKMGGFCHDVLIVIMS